jgi:hypothetical protein
MQLTAKKSPRSFRPAALAVVLMLLAGVSVAHAAKPMNINQTADVLREQVKKIDADAKAGKRGWDNVSSAKKTRFTEARDQVFALLDGKKSAAQLEVDQRTELASALDTINTLAKEADDERMVCTREHKVGEFRPIETCMTVGERRRQREADQGSMERQRNR